MATESELRHWQAKGARDIVAAWDRDALRVLYVAPQGAGKTRVAAAALPATGRALWLTPSRETAIQAHEVLTALGVACAFRLAGAPAAATDTNGAARVFVGTVASVRQDPPDDIDTIVVDEAHHTPARTWRELLARYPTARRLGLTGSPWRLDGQPLDDHYDVLVEGPKPSALIALGHLAEPLVYTWDRGLELPSGDGAGYAPEVMEAAARRVLVGDVYETWTRRAAGMPTVVFAATLEHSREFAAGFSKRGVAAAHLDGHLSTGQRDALLASFRAGETRVLSTVGVLSEGWDMPSAQCMVSARPMRSLTLWLQQSGRVTRPGARRVILDHVGNALRLLHPSHDHDWSLDAHAAEALRGAGALVPCPACNLAVSPACAACPGCGHVFNERERAAMIQLAGELVPLRRMSPRQLWEFYVERARVRGEYIHAAIVRYERATGEAPPADWYPRDQAGLGDREYLRETARRLGRPLEAAAREFARLRARGEYLPQPRPRMPQLRESTRRLVAVPAKVALADAAAHLRAALRTKLLAALEKHGWNARKATRSLGLSEEAVATYCAAEYAGARAADRGLRKISAADRAEIAAGRKETLTQAAKRHDVGVDSIVRRLRAAGVVPAQNVKADIYVLDPAVVDRVLAERPIRAVGRRAAGPARATDRPQRGRAGERADG